MEKSRVSDRGRTAVRCIERAWAQLRALHPELPEVVVVLLPAGARAGRRGHFAPACWRFRADRSAHELAISPHLFESPEETLATIVHEAAHALNWDKRVRDVSGRYYHLVEFRDAVQMLGLECGFYNTRYGWCLTRFPAGAVPPRYAPVLQTLERGLPLGTGGRVGPVPPGKDTPEPGQVRLACRCPAEERRSIYVSRSVRAAGGVFCRRCASPFYPDEATPFRETVLPAAFYDRDPRAVAEDLVRQGVLLVRVVGGVLLAGRIVEAEAYLAEGDPACHAARDAAYPGDGRPPRRHQAMYGPAGTAYVYTMHQATCFNVVTEAPGRPSAVLIRALEPVAGEAAMRTRRSVTQATYLTSGPGKVCQALAITRSAFDGRDLTCGEDLWLARLPAAAARPPSGKEDALIVQEVLEVPQRAPKPEVTTVVTPRIGVTSGQDLLLRFMDPDSPFLSRRLGRGRGPDAEPAQQTAESEAML